MIKNTPIKKRSQYCYQRKVEKIKKWYKRLEKIRESNLNPINGNTKQPVKRKELKSLEDYISKIKKVNTNV